VQQVRDAANQSLLLVRLQRKIARETCHAIQIQNIKRLVAHGIQPYFALPHIHRLKLSERLIRRQ
jgi:hypothetical protein